jgi:DNA repair ATPase RecN
MGESDISTLGDETRRPELRLRHLLTGEGENMTVAEAINNMTRETLQLENEAELIADGMAAIQILLEDECTTEYKAKSIMLCEEITDKILPILKLLTRFTRKYSDSIHSVPELCTSIHKALKSMPDSSAAAAVLEEKGGCA